jgi:hypothetical protein
MKRTLAFVFVSELDHPSTSTASASAPNLSHFANHLGTNLGFSGAVADTGAQASSLHLLSTSILARSLDLTDIQLVIPPTVLSVVCHSKRIPNISGQHKIS